MSDIKESMDWENRWHRIAIGQATEEEKIDAAFDAGESRDVSNVAHLLRLLDDESGAVRYVALQSLVIHLDRVDEDLEAKCWHFLDADPDQDVRAMAVTCLGRIHWNSRSRTIFGRVLRELKKEGQPRRVADSLYSILFEIAGRPPSEWPGVGGDALGGADQEDLIDWVRVAALEDSLDRP